jgi:hypothetical protein
MPDHRPIDVGKKSIEFVNSKDFTFLIKCIVKKLIEIRKATKTTSPFQVFLSTDGGDIRTTMATRLRSEIERYDDPVPVEIEYFSASLPPANYWTWTLPFNEMHKVFSIMMIRTIT